jgi:NADPH-dependent 2,4-dienoyl-CoA reductase/sulfur reductase-like enzyme/nitrite reductase/ring-hydroxylating ferredoxin subunit
LACAPEWQRHSDEEFFMAGQQDSDKGPDLLRGIPLSDIPIGGLRKGHVGEDAVVLARSRDEVFAIGASCTHYHGPLAEGYFDGETVRCPWHHACFNVRTGEALRAPAIDPVGAWTVEQRNGKIFVTGRKSTVARRARPESVPSRIVIIGGGAAGFAAAEMLRREQYQHDIIMLSDDDAGPVDRPNLSKDYLAGNAPEDWVPLRPAEWYRENHIGLRLNARVERIDVRARTVELAGGESVHYDCLLLATGAEPVRLNVPGAEQPHVHVLRSLKQCRGIIAAAQGARRVVVIGASFIGLEVAAALRARKLDVHVVAPDKRPLEKVFGPELGDFIRGLHQQNGVVFHLENSVEAIDGQQVRLKGGATLAADLVVVGIGVRPRVTLAEQAGLKLDRGIAVNGHLQTSAPGIFAAGDIARWPDRHSGEYIRVEHWVVAERQGQCAARNMIGLRERYDHVPFFWSQHYDVPINYVGHATEWDTVEIDGDINARNCLVRYKKSGKVRAVASIYRDVDSLVAEHAMEQALEESPVAS